MSRHVPHVHIYNLECRRRSGRGRVSSARTWLACRLTFFVFASTPIVTVVERGTEFLLGPSHQAPFYHCRLFHHPASSGNSSSTSIDDQYYPGTGVPHRRYINIIHEEPENRRVDESLSRGSDLHSEGWTDRPINQFLTIGFPARQDPSVKLFRNSQLQYGMSAAGHKG